MKLTCALRWCAIPVVFAAGSMLLLGQDGKPDQSTKPGQDAAPVHSLLSTDASDTVPAGDPPYKPITIKQKYIYSIEQMFSGPRMIAILSRAAIDQAEVNPHAWGSDSPAFGVRVASQFGRSFVRATIGSGIRALDHEDPRYFYSHKKDPWERTKYAIIHTYEVHNDNGSMMPAYSRFIGDVGMPFLAQTWHPGGYDAPQALRSGAISLGLGMGMSIAQEFWPDVKHALHMGPGAAALVSPGHIH